MRWLITLMVLVTAGVLSARQVELGFPGLEHRVKVFLPEGHDQSKKYPTVFYYHGAGGAPDTSYLRLHTRDKHWIIVGMAYYRLGSVSYDAKSLENARHLFRSVQNHLKVKHGLDPQRCYVAGFSKGGWLADMMLQSEPGLAGGVILGAGHLDKVKANPARYRNKKPVFVGIGRKDPNYPFALQSVMFHRKQGAASTLEIWNELGHTVPEDGSHGLHQWLAIQGQGATALRAVAKREMQLAYDEALERKPLARWDRLRQLQKLPYAALMGKAWVADLERRLAELEQSDPVRQEVKVLALHRKWVLQEIKVNTMENMMKVHPEYQKLADQYSGTRQATLAQHDAERTAVRIEQFAKQASARKDKTEHKRDSKRPAKSDVDLPTDQRRIPRNPLIR
ncbi:hypothetical protein HW115_06230 [Verrucomicrobiaceae bacterium N1E253]|uniref:Dienelactone hydrolase domain-containing protein n=1 Tax=Oceaniferula marina TaxID=2748318 RepID=A0A851GDE7_9BACT|nr:hypothetical protein [Oceaniferula marina]NWK55199.1 hypothetical protein [Oceaniferula marina]